MASLGTTVADEVAVMLSFAGAATVFETI